MNNQNFYNKPRIFVRYPPGSGGHFLCLLIHALRDPALKLKESHRGHAQISLINQGHNFDTQWTLEFRKQTGLDVDPQQSAQWLLANFEFQDHSCDFYTVHTHIKNYQAIACAWPDAKIVNITCGLQDLDQLCYNWITKSLFFHAGQWNIIGERLKNLQTRHGKLMHVNADQVDQITDVKLLTYIHKFGWLDFDAWTKAPRQGVYNVDFLDLRTGQVSEKIEALIEFLELDVTKAGIENAKEMIRSYSESQISVPWTLPLDLYN